MMRIVLVCGLLSAATVLAEDNEVKVQLKDLPGVVQGAARAQSKGATVRGYSKEIENGKTYYEVETRVGAKNRDVLLDESGSVVEVEQQIDIDKVPSRVIAVLRKQASGGEILSIESVTKGTNISYEAVITKAGRKREVAVSATGQPLKPE